MVLDKIKQYNDVRRVPAEELPILADEIRSFLIRRISENGGHLASNLGVVELTIALHRCLHFPEDKIVWDVGHQAYTHKLLTGRREGFYKLRKAGGMSGFPKRSESPCDAFDTGHSSTSISAGLGYVYARDLKKEHYTVVSVIGDGSMTGGMAFEALNNAAALNSNFIIILNDNAMSISRNVGGMSRYLSGIRTYRGYNDLKENVATTLKRIPLIGGPLAEGISRTKSTIKQMMIPGMLFENMGITYLGPVDGHDIDAMTQVINDAKNLDRAVIIHVRTQKGRGYDPAEQSPECFHGVGPFRVETGEPLRVKKEKTCTDIFSETLVRLAEADESIVGITAAMAEGTGMAAFAKRFPKRFFDVGIAEEHAVTFAAGLAAGGLHPVLAVYSSFLQRGFDQIVHDVCMQQLPVIFAIDRAGLVGDDGETHQGVFDLSYLRMIPGMTVIAPKNRWELEDALVWAASVRRPVAIRYPKTAASAALSDFRKPFSDEKCEVLQSGKDAVLYAAGTMVETAWKAAEILEGKGIKPSVVNLRFVKPLDLETVLAAAGNCRVAVTLEENALAGGIGEEIGNALAEAGIECRVIPCGIPDRFIPQGGIEELKQNLCMDAEDIAKAVQEALGRTAAP